MTERTLPTALKNANRWVEWSSGNGKNAKIPLNPHTHKAFSANSGWQKKPELWATYDKVASKEKVGFLLGDGFACIDLDGVVVNGKVLPWAQRLVDRMNTYTEVSVSGKGLHLWFRTTTEGKAIVKALGHVEIYYKERFMAVTGVHFESSPTELREDDSSVLQAFYDSFTHLDLVERFEFVDGVVRPADEGCEGESCKIGVTCPWSDDHTDNTGVLEAALLTDHSGEVKGFKCLHSHCADKELSDVLKWAGLSATKKIKVKKRSTNNGWVMLGNDIDPNIMGNVDKALRLTGVEFRWNEFRQRAELRSQANREWIAYEGKHYSQLLLAVAGFIGGHAPNLTLFNHLIDRMPYENEPVHAVKDYLNKLVWDGVPRLNTWLIDFAGAEDSHYVQAVSSIVLIAAVRRVRQPGVKFDELLILESAQGTNKSSALRLMAAQDEWYSDDFPLALKSQQVVEATGGKWLIEAAELRGLNRKTEAADLKNFLSRGTDGPVRAAYGRIAVEVPRSFIVIGTTNNTGGYLPDQTGNRRFWPVPIVAFNLERLAIARDQLWAEAAAREAKGEPIRLHPSLYTAAAVEQSARTTQDPWDDKLEDLLAGREAIQAMELWGALSLTIGHISVRESSRLTPIMTRLGFKKRKALVDGETTGTSVASWFREGSTLTRVPGPRYLTGDSWPQGASLE